MNKSELLELAKAHKVFFTQGVFNSELCAVKTHKDLLQEIQIDSQICEYIFPSANLNLFFEIELKEPKEKAERDAIMIDTIKRIIKKSKDIFKNFDVKFGVAFAYSDEKSIAHVILRFFKDQIPFVFGNIKNVISVVDKHFKMFRGINTKVYTLNRCRFSCLRQSEPGNPLKQVFTPSQKYSSTGFEELHFFVTYVKPNSQILPSDLPTENNVSIYKSSIDNSNFPAKSEQYICNEIENSSEDSDIFDQLPNLNLIIKIQQNDNIPTPEISSAYNLTIGRNETFFTNPAPIKKRELNCTCPPNSFKMKTKDVISDDAYIFFFEPEKLKKKLLEIVNERDPGVKILTVVESIFVAPVTHLFKRKCPGGLDIEIDELTLLGSTHLISPDGHFIIKPETKIKTLLNNQNSFFENLHAKFFKKELEDLVLNKY